jgi:hypothetical protein
MQEEVEVDVTQCQRAPGDVDGSGIGHEGHSMVRPTLWSRSLGAVMPRHRPNGALAAPDFWSRSLGAVMPRHRPNGALAAPAFGGGS